MKNSTSLLTRLEQTLVGAKQKAFMSKYASPASSSQPLTPR